MNGRCETDPFDQAVNVCGLCYGEFCQTCLVAVKGRKHPLCKDCAIVSAGLRAGAKPVIRGSRKTAKARRTELAAAPPQAGFEYFDVQPLDPEATASEVVDALRAASETYSENGAGDIAENGGATQKRKRRSKKDKGEAASPAAKKAAKKASKKAAKATSKALADGDKSPGEADAKADPEAVPAGPSAVNQLDKIRGSDDEAVDTDETTGGEQASFRKPRPFIKSPDESAAAKPAATRSGSKPKTKSTSQSNSGSSTQSNTLPKRRVGETAAPKGNTGGGLPRRRATPDSGPASKSVPAASRSEVTARTENAAATESASGELPRRRARGKGASANGPGSQKSGTRGPSEVPPALQKPGAKKGPATKPAGKTAAGRKAPAPTHRAGQETAAAKDRRRPKGSGQASKAKPQSLNTMSDQVEPPAWTQKNRQGTKAKATDKDRDKDKVKVKDKEAESATLPKRRRKGGPPKSVAG